MSKHSKLYVMSFGLGGNCGKGISKHGNKYSSSWYLKPDELQHYIDNEHYSKEELEGCWLIDTCDVLRKKPSLAFYAPMCNPELADGEVDKFENREYFKDPVGVAILKEVARTPVGAALVLSAFKGGLDYVSLVEYVQWWKEHGAKIGTVKDGKVQWFD
jgi:hypothetical protein